MPRQTPAQKIEKYKKLVKKLETAKARLESRHTKLELEEKEFNSKSMRTKLEMEEEVCTKSSVAIVTYVQIEELKWRLSNKNQTLDTLQQQMHRS